MTARATACALFVALGASAAWAVSAQGEPIPRGQTATVYVTETVASTYAGHSPRFYAMRLGQTRTRLKFSERRRTEIARRLALANRNSRRRWAPTLSNAVALASAVTGVPASELRRVAWCESTDNPFASNGTHWGYWQLSWHPFGLSPYDPYAAALSTAMTVKHDGDWGQWAASRPCSGLR